MDFNLPPLSQNYDHYLAYATSSNDSSLALLETRLPLMNAWRKTSLHPFLRLTIMKFMPWKQSETRWYLQCFWRDLTPVDTWRLTKARETSKLDVFNYRNNWTMPPNHLGTCFVLSSMLKCDMIQTSANSSRLYGPSFFYGQTQWFMGSPFVPWCTQMIPQLSKLHWSTWSIASSNIWIGLRGHALHR